jgi:hypothetical protein
MTSENEALTLGRISSESVRDATGRGWEEWLSESGSGKTAITAHLERLPDADAREAMRKRWREALERIATAAP